VINSEQQDQSVTIFYSSMQTAEAFTCNSMA